MKTIQYQDNCAKQTGLKGYFTKEKKNIFLYTVPIQNGFLRNLFQVQHTNNISDRL